MTTPRYQGDNILRDMAAAKKKDSYRREGKGRRCGLADRIASNLCRAGYFAKGRFEDKGANQPILQHVLVPNS